MGLNRDLGNIPEVVTVSGNNVGVGTNSSSWFSFSRAIDIGAGGAIQGRSNTSGTFELSTNSFLNSSGNWVYKSSSVAANLFAMSNGSYTWNLAPSGTSGNSITFTQAMTLNTNGNVLIGTTTDNGSRLQVNGSISTTSLRLSGNYNTTVTTDSNWSSYQTMIPTGTLSNNATYLISVRWDFGSGSNQPYYCYCSFLFQGAFTNSGGGTDNEFTPMCSTHTGGMGSTISFRAVAGIATTAGIQARLNNFATRGGTLTVRAILLE